MKRLGLALGLWLLLGCELTQAAGLVNQSAAPNPYRSKAAPLALTSATSPAATVTLMASDYLTFNELMQAARSSAHAFIDRAFAADPALGAVNVQIVAEHVGTIVPLGLTSVSREDWRSQPNLDLWSQWFGGSAQALLGFGTGAAQTAQTQTDQPEAESVPRGRSGRARQILLNSQ